MKCQEISWKSWFMEFLHFCESGGPKTLIFLGKYWCFRNVMICVKFHFCIENFKIPWFFTFSTFPKNLNENALFLKKMALGAQDPPKCIVFHWFKQHSRRRAARVRKVHFSGKRANLFVQNSWKIEKFHEFQEIHKNLMILDMSEPLVIPRKYYTFLKKQGLLGGPGSQKCVFGRNDALFRFWGS